MGEVYLAEDLKLRRQVALKVLPRELSEDGERLERFRREAQAAAALQHANIVRIYSIETSEDLLFLTMEVVRGRTLAEAIPAGGLPLDKLLPLALALADAVAAAHQSGITHRDLKPANVLIDADGNPKIVDFGLAKMTRVEPGGAATAMVTEALSAEGQVWGTVPYMSPEQLEGLPVSHASDVFSLGAVFYEMATGNRPFQGESSAALMSAILRDEPSALHEVRPELPRQLSRIIDRSLAKRPDDRYTSARGLSSDLRRLDRELRSGSEAAAPEESPRIRSGRWLAAALALLAVLALAWSAGVFDRSPAETNAGAASDADRTMIAVLPFEDIDADPERQFFSDGMTEEMITVLGGASPERLGVIARGSAMRFKGTTASIREIGRELGVSHVLEGTVRRQGERVRISARLVQVADETQVWSRSFDGTLTDVFGLQAGVAHQVAEALSVRLIPGALTGSESRQMVPEAYEEYLAGRFWAHKATDAGWSKAVGHYERAVELDPGFAIAHASLADAYANKTMWRPERVDEQAEKARASALKALELNPQLSEAHSAFALVSMFFDWDWDVAVREFERALELNPRDANAFHHFGHLLDFLGRDQEGLEACLEATRLDPLSAFHRTCVGYTRVSLGDFEEAHRDFARAFELVPQYPMTLYAEGRAFDLQGDYERAVASWEKGVALTGRANRFALGALGYGYAKLGRTSDARAVLLELIEDFPEPITTAFYRAPVLAGLGDFDGAVEELKLAVEGREPWIVGVRLDPGFRLLAADERFQALLAEIHPG